MPIVVQLHLHLIQILLHKFLCNGRWEITRINPLPDAKSRDLTLAGLE